MPVVVVTSGVWPSSTGVARPGRRRGGIEARAKSEAQIGRARHTHCTRPLRQERALHWTGPQHGSSSARRKGSVSLSRIHCAVRASWVTGRRRESCRWVPSTALPASLGVSGWPGGIDCCRSKGTRRIQRSLSPVDPCPAYRPIDLCFLARYARGQVTGRPRCKRSRRKGRHSARLGVGHDREAAKEPRTRWQHSMGPRHASNASNPRGAHHQQPRDPRQALAESRCAPSLAITSGLVTSKTPMQGSLEAARLDDRTQAQPYYQLTARLDRGRKA